MVNLREQASRNTALWIIGVMVILWTALGIFSFVDSETRVRPHTKAVVFGGQNGLYGKQVFQSYNCMDCHTIVGNGAYFAPDLTKIYEQVGPAWLMAYLGSPGTYPAEAIVNIQLNELVKSGDIDIKDMEAYYAKYPKAQERIKERGGVDALMPNLQFTKEEINGLIAFLDYTSRINTAGWPPEVRAKDAVIENTKREMEAKSGLRTQMATVAAPGSADSEDSGGSSVNGEQVANDMGCMACHSTDGSVRIGPSWKALYDHDVTLVGGQKVKADEEYLKRSILQPNDDIVDGYQPGLMPSYEGTISDGDLNAIIEYIKSIK